MPLHINRMNLDGDMSSIQNISPSILERVVYNENILEQIFKFLPIKDLLRTRLVCTKWNSESNRILKLRPTLIVLRTEEDIENIVNVMDKYKVSSSTPLFTKFLILFENIYLEQATVYNFLNSYGPSFEELSVKFSWALDDTMNTPQSFKYLLEHQVTNLKKLQFFGFSEELWQSGELFNDCENLLPKLESIGCITVDNYRHALECPLYVTLFSRLPSVKRITINCSNYWDILFNLAASNDGLRKFFSEVEEINTQFNDDRIMKLMDSLEQHQAIEVPTILRLMPHLCPKVRILRLSFAYNFIENGNVGNLLRQYADQLKELWIDVDVFTHRDSDTAYPVVADDFFSTSVFRKLRVFRSGANIFQSSNTVIELFHKQLPMLEHLTVPFKIPAITNLNFKHSRLHTLELEYSQDNADCLLAIGKAFPNIKTLRLTVSGEDALQKVTRAFPNLEELHVTYVTTKVNYDGIASIAAHKHLRLLTIHSHFTDVSIGWLTQMKNVIFLNICNCYKEAYDYSRKS